MGWFEFECEKCEHQWDVIQSWRDPVPNECPSCKNQECVRKLISLPARGVVELTGHELTASIKEQAQKDKAEILKSENKLANVVGESKYHANQSIKE